MRVKIVRIFNTYGPRMAVDDGRVVSNFIVQALRNEPLTIYGDGCQTRSFMYIDDLLEGMVRMMATADEVTGPVNLGNPEEITIKELADVVIGLTGSKSVMENKEIPKDDPKVRCPSLYWAHNVLKDWQPMTKLTEGLRQTIVSFEELDMQSIKDKNNEEYEHVGDLSPRQPDKGVFPL